MRDIEFRGKRIDNGEWVYGHVCRYGWTGKENTYIIPNYASALYSIEVIPETIGQYTGLKDKNGTKIFEGDMISTDLERPYNIVEYRNGCFVLNCYDGGSYYDIMFPTSDEQHTKYGYGTVIGNIYDNKLEDFNNG